MSIDSRKAELGKRELEGPDPSQGNGAQTFGTGDSAMDLAWQLLDGATTAEDIAAAIQFAPGFTRAIVMVVHKKFAGRAQALIDEALYKSGSKDTTAGIANREALAVDGVSNTDTTAPAANGALPFTATGWDAVTINRTLGQYDRMAGTDSDGSRCAFAVGLAAHVFKGPDAVVRYALEYMDQATTRSKLDAKIAAETDPAKKAALQAKKARLTAANRVVMATTGAIAAKSATYSDLSWLQEALHDGTLGDNDGAPSSGYALEDGNVTSRDQVAQQCYYNADDVIAKAGELAEGEQRMVEWAFPAGKGTGHHEMLIAKQDGALYLYDSERQADGNHLRTLDAAALAPYFKQPGSSLTLTIKLFPAAPAPKPAAATGPRPTK